MPKRDVSVFGASFLDLLAGALGAVIILYVIVPKLTAEAMDALEQLESLSVEINDLERIIDEHRSSVPSSVFDEILERFRSLERQISTLREQVEELQRQAARADRLEAELTAAQARIAELEAAERRMAELEARLERAESDLRAANDEIRKLRVKHLDILILIDITGSMGAALEGLKGEINNVIKVLNHIAPSLGIGIVAYGDKRQETVVFEFPIVDLTVSGNQTRLNSFIQSMSLNMGLGRGSNPELPEALHLAMERAMRANWRPNAEERYMVIITDAPPYSDEEENVYRMARTFASNPGNYISTVHVRDNRIYEKAREVLQRLAQIGDGSYIDSSSGESFMTYMLIAVIQGS